MPFLGLQEKNARLVKQLILAVVLLFFMTVVPQTIGLARGGFSLTDINDNLRQFFFYVAPGIGYITIIVLLVFIGRVVNKGDFIYGDSLAFYSPGQKPHLPGKMFEKPWRLILACIIIFGALGLIGGATKQTYFGVGQLQQGFTKIDNILYSASLISTSENMGAAAFAALGLFALGYYARRKWVKVNNFTFLAWVIGIGSYIVYGVSNHLLRYGSSDLDLMQVMIIWGAGGAITMITGSVLAFLVLHSVNNIFYELGRSFSNDSVPIYIGTVLVLLSFLWVWLYVVRKPKVKDDA